MSTKIEQVAKSVGINQEDIARLVDIGIDDGSLEPMNLDYIRMDKDEISDFKKLTSFLTPIQSDKLLAALREESLKAIRSFYSMETGDQEEYAAKNDLDSEDLAELKDDVKNILVEMGYIDGGGKRKRRKSKRGKSKSKQSRKSKRKQSKKSRKRSKTRRRR